jgi:hypothetical protein
MHGSVEHHSLSAHTAHSWTSHRLGGTFGVNVWSGPKGSESVPIDHEKASECSVETE